MNPDIQSLFDLLKEGLPLAREALKKIKDAKVSALLRASTRSLMMR